MRKPRVCMASFMLGWQRRCLHRAQVIALTAVERLAETEKNERHRIKFIFG